MSPSPRWLTIRASLKLLTFFPIVTFWVCSHVNAQEIAANDIILFNKQRSIGVTLSSQGFGASGYFARYRGAYKLWQVNADFNFVKHEKETKTWNPIQDPNARPYFYGKLNSFYSLRTGLGVKKIITEKLRKSGVQVSWQWAAGPVLGILKPVYLEIIKENSLSQPYIEIEPFDPSSHYMHNIYGRASSLRGIDKLSSVPGAFVKLSFSFEYSNEREAIKGIEVGACADMFAKKVNIMSFSDHDGKNPSNHRLFLSVYVNFFFGTKYDQK
jgi:hypothetical protein